MPESFADIGIIILAAGSSSRLGKPKQLLPYKHTSLLGHAIETAMATGCAPIIVVTGAMHQEIVEDIAEYEMQIAYNPFWKQGMASSIKIGLDAILKHTEPVAGVLIMLCDQPLITPDHLINVCQAFKGLNCTSPVATTYKETIGVPAIFPSSMYPNLKELEGDEGARKLLKHHAKEIASVPFDQSAVDVDTIDDYLKLINNKD